MTAFSIPTVRHPDARDILDDLVRSARRAGADAADGLLIDGRSISVTCRNGKLESLEQAEGGDIGLRVLIGKRQAIVSSGDRSKAALAELVERAMAMARSVPEDHFAGLADPSDLAHTIPDLDNFDPREASADELIGMARAAEEAARSVSGVTNSEGADASWGTSTVTLVASNGFEHSYRTSGSSLSVSVIAGEGSDGMERDYEWTSTVWLSDLADPQSVGRKAGERTVRRLGARKIKTCKVPVVFESRVARGLVGSLCGAINGASIARGTSFLKDSLGQRVFSPGIHITEDPHRPRGLRSRPVDAEGLPTVRRRLIEDGILTTWTMDLASARQLGLKSTGHAVRGVSAPPSPGVSNVWLEPGKESLDAMLARIGTGLMVTDLFGQGVNMVTGDYSRGCSGFWIEKGQIAFPVHEITIAGNLRDMFRTIAPANDLEFLQGTDAPSVCVEGMTIAGS
ncbi:TldD/PmbA family protein [Haematospirillum sp. H1815]|uniref:TldD/PmbA family protein n=1 Tax=Haematospirillum sp. H1815 TaxID=2723108 RepID=UPI001438A3ED|nr:metallopeptidase TldD-related protein [Haematospirillum sp. H1815]NKD76893.1 TldD/PmbA family protein [Haematospirillum sp. H1815]